MKRILCLLLALMAVLCLFASCGKDRSTADEEDDTSVSDGNETEEKDDEDKETEDSEKPDGSALPDDGKNEDDKNEDDKNEDGKNEDDPDDTTDYVAEFAKMLKECDYVKAASLYKNHMKGNAKLEAGAVREMTVYVSALEVGVSDGSISEDDFGICLKSVQYISGQTGLISDKVSKCKQTAEKIFKSKSNFLIAEEFKGLGNWKDAIRYYGYVVQEDGNYIAASKAISECKRSYKDEVFAVAESLLKNADYPSAINKLKSLLSDLPGDSEVKNKITVYESSHVKHALEEAEKAFVTPATDYEASLSIINGALQYYPSDASLKEMKAYYEAFIPVNLYDMKILKGYAKKYSTATDTYGNKYEKCFYAQTNYGVENFTSAIYDVGQLYNTFTATVFGGSSSEKAYIGTIVIYGDGRILYENFRVPDNGKPFEIHLDITGVSELHIEMEMWNSTGIGMTNVLLQRTAK